MVLRSPLVLALFLSVAVGSSAAIVAWRQRPKPGAMPLVGLLIGQTWWSTCIIFKLQATTLASQLFWIKLSSVGVALIPISWLLFALEYTGNDRYIRPWTVSVLAVVPVLTVVFALTTQYQDLLYIQESTAQSGPDLQLGGVWFWVIAGYTYLLGSLGTVPLFGMLKSGARAIQLQSVTLFVGVLAPWVTNVLFLAGVFPGSRIDPTPIAFSISGVAYLYGVRRHRLFETSPTPTKRARQYLFDQMDTGAAVVDRNDYIVHGNDTFFDIVGRSEREVLGAPASESIPEFESVPDEGTGEGFLTFGDGIANRSYDVRVTRISDVRDRLIGRVITFHDVSEYQRQQQRLKVLNRILRHNIRTETNVIYGYADQFTGDAADIVQDRAMRIAELGEKGRQAIDLFEEAHELGDSAPLTALLEQSIAAIRAESDVAVDRDLPPRDIRVAPVFSWVFSNLLENAAEHGAVDDGTRVRVDVNVREEDARVTIADDGTGIDEGEISVLEEGTETALKHGSGMGLWIVKWGVDIAGGDVHFRANEPTGTVVVVDVPILARSGESGSPQT
jgi:signal transduction histidine kinase